MPLSMHQPSFSYWALSRKAKICLSYAPRLSGLMLEVGGRPGERTEEGRGRGFSFASGHCALGAAAQTLTATQSRSTPRTWRMVNPPSSWFSVFEDPGDEMIARVPAARDTFRFVACQSSLDGSLSKP